MKLRIILIALTAALFAAGEIKSCSEEKTEENNTVVTATEVPKQERRSLTITATGDCTFATDSNADKSLGFVTYAEEYGNDYFLKNMKSLFEEDNLTIVNFEGTLSDGGEREDKQFAFRGKPEYVGILTGASVEAANLANNHSSDYGSVSLSDTKQILEDENILTCRGKDNVTVTEINGIRVGLVGINYLNDVMKTELEDAITIAKDEGAELIILSMHWGVEKATEPDEEQIKAAHTAIDCGADVVIGTHPHVLEGVEKYKGRYIYYSLGNFCFGGNNAPSDRDTAVIRQTFTLENGELIDDDNVTIIPCRICGEGDYNNYQPVIATGDRRERIVERMTEYTEALDGPSLTFYEE